ncbi:hypothetical protein V6N13_144855 [Hibiscus sabdariffa]|uniref:DUF7642 domain-containing protein n=1 Tax=Hibiscus sabdariffa TaxID=183260 RepID=A0ABR2FLN6_9ROSI
MGTGDEVVEIESLEKSLLPESVTEEEETEAVDDPVLYAASFEEMEEDFVRFQTAQWVLYSLVLVLAWGIGLFMLLYIPVRRYILRKDIRSKKLYLTPNSIVYKVTRPVPFPCFGVLKKEKHVLLPSVADVVIEQGYLQSFFGVYSLRIENVGVRRPPSDDLQIQGMVNPSAFRKAVLARLSNMRTSAIEDAPNLRILSSSAWRSPRKQDAVPTSGDLALLQKLEEVGSSVKRVQSLIEEQHGQASETAD